MNVGLTSKLRTEGPERYVPLSESTVRDALPTIPSSLFLFLTSGLDSALDSKSPEFLRMLEDIASQSESFPSDPNESVWPESRWPEVGETFHGFRLERLIGKGAMARVYLAIDSSLGSRRVVAKIAPFVGREAEILGKLEHSNIMPIHSIGMDHDRGVSLVCMPYLGEATLEDLLPKKGTRGAELPRTARFILECAALPSADPPQAATEGEISDVLRRGTFAEGVAYLGLKLASALAHAHARGIHHRDLKPANILLKRSGEPCLLDFNLSVEDVHDISCVGGTIPYMAPERIEEVLGYDDFRGSAFDPRTDVFSLGVVLYQLLSGRLPFGAPARGLTRDDQLLQMRERQKADVVPLDRLNRQVSRALANTIQACLELNPADRPQDAKQLESRLRQALFGPASLRWRVVSGPKLLVGAVSCALLLCGLAVAQLSQRPSHAMANVEAGRVALEAGRADDALVKLLVATREQPRNSNYWKYLGQAYSQKKDWRNGRACFWNSHQQSQDLLMAALAGYCAEQEGLYPSACGVYRIAFEKGFRPGWVTTNLAAAYFRMKLPSFAYQTLLQLDPQSAERFLPCYLRLAANLELPKPFVEKAVADAGLMLRLLATHESLNESDRAVVQLAVARAFALGAEQLTQKGKLTEAETLAGRAKDHLMQATALGRTNILSAAPIPVEVRQEVASQTAHDIKAPPRLRELSLPPETSLLTGMSH